MAWEEKGGAALGDTTGRWILVDDGNTSQARELLEGETIEEALAEYSTGYTCPPTTVQVGWHVYDAGVRVNNGHHAFEAGGIAPVSSPEEGEPVEE